MVDYGCFFMLCRFLCIRLLVFGGKWLFDGSQQIFVVSGFPGFCWVYPNGLEENGQNPLGLPCLW